MQLEWPKIFLFGDSQVQRSFEPVNGLWGALLCNRLQRICDVIPRGFSGYTSRSGLSVINHVFTPENILNVKAFVIFFGSNDSSGREEESIFHPYHVPVEEYTNNMEKIINYLMDIGLSKEKIILISPGPKYPMNSTESEGVCPSHENKIISEYVEACIKIANQLNIDVINLYEEIMKHEDWQKFLFDGLHLSVDGSYLVFELLWPLIEKRVDTSKVLCPYWRHVNPLSPTEVTDELILECGVKPTVNTVDTTNGNEAL